jgi:hypothetical protein
MQGFVTTEHILSELANRAGTYQRRSAERVVRLG